MATNRVALTPPLRPAACSGGAGRESKPEPKPERSDSTPRREPDVALFMRAVATAQPVQVVLKSGRAYTGRVRQWGLYSVELATADGDIVLFKSAIEGLKARDEH